MDTPLVFFFSSGEGGCCPPQPPVMEAGGPACVLMAESGEMCATTPHGSVTPSSIGTLSHNLILVGIFCLLPLQESPGTQIFIPGAANIQFTFLAEMFGASSLYKSLSDHSVLFPEHTFPWHVLLSRKIEGSDSEIEMP